MRFIKDVNVGASRLRLYVTASNIFNKAAVTARNQFFGGGGAFSPDYDRPTDIQDGRALSFGCSGSSRSLRRGSPGLPVRRSRQARAARRDGS